MNGWLPRRLREVTLITTNDLIGIGIVLGVIVFLLVVDTYYGRRKGG